ncbi:hypothetical protein FSB73_07140 [Arachidicoccus ginsenosidivorans]|uniref:Acyl-CoA dehydrogenase C-terminal domain-containing protein n=1 Tax=Arachidicoccus ginsenosidivorans TaxID=496057 RepID=A0A5B8VIR1_9BACT|nr:hypothetical protein [Arachidicoccus ginsenosidivorans]QEC71477.1 hypothetical protein FSB73_07140 [Arachidicoccus ginsenosidivorans]
MTVIKSWHSIGLRASASESFMVKRRSFPAERFFQIDPDKAVINAPLYRLPFGALAMATIAANLSGMALRFMEEVKALWDNKKGKAVAGRQNAWQPTIKMQRPEALWEEYWQNWQAARTRLIQKVQYLEDFIASHMSNPIFGNHKTYQRHSLVVSRAAQRQVIICREIVNGLYPYTGLTGASMDSTLGKVWRDFQTGSQHALFVPVK